MTKEEIELLKKCKELLSTYGYETASETVGYVILDEEDKPPKQHFEP